MSYTTEAARWRALTVRDAHASGQFVYAVKSTKIYCRPTCPARLARRANIGFYKTPVEAQAAGFRACKRCKPEMQVRDDPQERAVARACGIINAAVWKAEDEGFAKKGLRLQDLAASVGLTPRYFHKIFKEKTGVTPNAYGKIKMQREKENQLEIEPEPRPNLTEGNPNTTTPEELDLDVFQFNDLTLDSDLDLLNCPSLGNSWMMGDPDQTLSIAFGQEMDADIPKFVWNSDYGSDSMVSGLCDDGDGDSGSILDEQLKLYDTLQWQLRDTNMTSLDVDPALLFNAHANVELIDVFDWTS